MSNAKVLIKNLTKLGETSNAVWFKLPNGKETLIPKRFIQGDDIIMPKRIFDERAQQKRWELGDKDNPYFENHYNQNIQEVTLQSSASVYDLTEDIKPEKIVVTTSGKSKSKYLITGYDIEITKIE